MPGGGDRVMTIDREPLNPDATAPLPEPVLRPAPKPRARRAVIPQRDLDGPPVTEADPEDADRVRLEAEQAAALDEERRLAEAAGPEARVLYRSPDLPPVTLGPALRALAAVAAVLIIFAMGAAFGRSTVARPSAGDDPAAQEAGTQAPAAPAPDDAPAGTGTTTGIAAAGPASVRDGVPVGYARSRAGAVAAATNYVGVQTSTLMLEESRRRRAVTALAAPSAAAGLQASAERNATAMAAALRTSGATGVILRAIPVGARVDRYNNNAATVSIWLTSIGGSTNGVPVRQSWGVTTVTLQWAGGDWKQVAASTTLGPVPLADGAQPTAASELIGKTKDFKEYTYAPGP
jgi:hypothetical protein